MSNVIYSNCAISITEANASMLVNFNNERFYFIPCNEQEGVFTNATLSRMDDGSYEIEGTQLLYTEHKDISLSYEKLLCMHPCELISKQSFLGFTWYKAIGIMKREVRTRYVCKHKVYQIHERHEFLSHTFIQEI
jgi:hypothetical protein